MGMMSARLDHRLANVWNKKLPTPTTSVNMDNTQSQAEPLYFLSHRGIKNTRAAITNEILDNALMGSAQKSADILSQ